MKLPTARVLTVSMSLLSFAACGGSDNDDNIDAPSGAWRSTVEMSVAKKDVRMKETPIGNLVADALMEAAVTQAPQFALVNGGSLRCPMEFGPDCDLMTWAAGPLDQSFVDSLFPFGNTVVTMSLTGAQIKSALETAVKALPSERKGWFLHASKGFEFTVDCSQPAQVQTGATYDVATITTEGQRVSNIKLDGVAIDPTTSYKVVTSNFVAAGQDFHVALRDQSAQTAPVETGMIDKTPLEMYLTAHSPVSPAVESRITLVNCPGI
jgi:5'-nucleotidase